MIVYRTEDYEAMSRRAAAILAAQVTSAVPASILQMHPSFTLVGDRAALSLLPEEAGA